jgi:hypothetical protein
LENYQSSLVYGLYLVKPQYSIDAGISRAFADKKINLKLSVSDIFDMRRNDVNSVFQANNIYIRQKNETRIARLTFTYNFGNSSIKSRNRQTVYHQATRPFPVRNGLLHIAKGILKIQYSFCI